MSRDHNKYSSIASLGVHSGLYWKRYFPQGLGAGIFLSAHEPAIAQSVDWPPVMAVVITGVEHPDHPGEWLALVDRQDRWATPDEFRSGIQALSRQLSEVPAPDQWEPTTTPLARERLAGPDPLSGHQLHRSRWKARP